MLFADAELDLPRTVRGEAVGFFFGIGCKTLIDSFPVRGFADVKLIAPAAGGEFLCF